MPQFASAKRTNSATTALSFHPVSPLIASSSAYFARRGGASAVYREIYDHGLLERQFADAVEARADVEEVA